MRNIIASLSLLLAIAVAGSDTMLHQPDADQIERLDHACRHYENRARFLPREGPVTFLVLIADDCRAAIGMMDRGGHDERAAALAFLTRLERLRTTIGGINSDRIFGAEAGPRAKPQAAAGVMSTMSQVSESGEFLIAHRMGVVEAHESWRVQAAPYTVAKAN